MIYILEAKADTWLYPLFEVLGFLCQLLSLPRKTLILLINGLLLTTLGAVLERDIVLAMANFLTVIGFYIIFFYKK